MTITIKPLSPELLNDFLHFFDTIVFTENPEWSKCYCYSFHFVGPHEAWTLENNRQQVIEYIKANKMRGYLAYENEKPIGWCNANNRNNYERLLKYHQLVGSLDEKVCAVVCFLIHPGFRGWGVANALLRQIISDYTAHGYAFVEAYPGKGELSCEMHYKGPISMYHKLGFETVKEEQDHFVVRIKLTT